MQTSQEHFTSIVYAKFRGQTVCIVGNWKVENGNRSLVPYSLQFMRYETTSTYFRMDDDISCLAFLTIFLFTFAKFVFCFCNKIIRRHSTQNKPFSSIQRIPYPKLSVELTLNHIMLLSFGNYSIIHYIKRIMALKVGHTILIHNYAAKFQNASGM